MRFQKGHKFAKGGARKGSGRKPAPRTELGRLALDNLEEEAEKSIRFLVNVRNSSKHNIGVRVLCAMNLVDRRFGKPRQSHEVKGGMTLKADELIEILQEERKARGLPPE